VGREVVYDVVARAYLPHPAGHDIPSYGHRLADSIRSFWPTMGAERLAEKMKLARNNPVER
jgi:hypothetical protein